MHTFRPVARTARLAGGAVALLALACARAATTPTPSPAPEPAVITTALPTGQLLGRMHDRYAGKWFRTLTFSQRTTITPPDGQERVSTWLESSEAPDKLRIDVGPLDSANGVLYRNDSTYRIVRGKVVRAVAQGNPFMPFVVGIYTQPVAQSLGQLAREKYDTSRVHLDTWQGRRVEVVGAVAASDTTSPQFWVDLERLVVVRVLLPVPDGSGRVEELRLDGYQQFGASWVATQVSIALGGKVVQREDYSNVRVDVALDPALFDPNAWTTARHWAAASAAP